MTVLVDLAAPISPRRRVLVGRLQAAEKTRRSSRLRRIVRQRELQPVDHGLNRTDVVLGGDFGAAHCSASCSAGRPETQKPCDLQGFYEYRHGDSNPGFRRERASED